MSLLVVKGYNCCPFTKAFFLLGSLRLERTGVDNKLNCCLTASR